MLFDKRTGKYSRGMLQRLGLADVLIKDPEVIILDEPTLGIDPKGVWEFLELIRGIKQGGWPYCTFFIARSAPGTAGLRQVGLFVSGRLLAEGDVHTLSQKLFANSPYTVEAGFLKTPDGAFFSDRKKSTIDDLVAAIIKIDGIIKVELINDVFQIECSRDLTSEIARLIVESGAELNYLNRKEYALDDIYYRFLKEVKMLSRFKNEDKVLHPFRVIVNKEISDHVHSWRFIILIALIGLTCLGSMYTALTNMGHAVKPEDPEGTFFFLKIFTISDGTLPPFIVFIGFLGPLLGISLGFDAINSEQNNRTLSRVLAQPIYRDYLINAKFVAALTVISVMFFALGFLVIGLGLITIGIPPTAEEFHAHSLFHLC